MKAAPTTRAARFGIFGDRGRWRVVVGCHSGSAPIQVTINIAMFIHVHQCSSMFINDRRRKRRGPCAQEPQEPAELRLFPV